MVRTCWVVERRQEYCDVVASTSYPRNGINQIPWPNSPRNKSAISAASCLFGKTTSGERKIVLEVTESYFEILILTAAYIYPPIDMMIDSSQKKH
jgi:hypothetical protein